MCTLVTSLYARSATIKPQSIPNSELFEINRTPQYGEISIALILSIRTTVDLDRDVFLQMLDEC